MNRARVVEACGGQFQLPGVIIIVLKDKHSGVAVSQMDSTTKKSLKNEVRKRVLAVLFIENANRRIYYETMKTLENDYLMGQEKYPRDMDTIHKLLVNYNPMVKSSGKTSNRIVFVTYRRPRNQKKNQRSRVFDAGSQDTTSPIMHVSNRTSENIMQTIKWIKQESQVHLNIMKRGARTNQWRIPVHKC